MPPEHLKEVTSRTSMREPVAFNVSSDVYSFAALLYELLTGVTPAPIKCDVNDSATIAEQMLNRLRSGIAPLREQNRLVSRRLESIVLKCLSLETNERPTIGHVKQTLAAERRSLAAAGRLARVRPAFFSAFVIFPGFLIATAITNISLQPPRYVKHYENGLRLFAERDFEEAMDYFSASIEANAAFSPARFEMGRALVKSGELDRAIDQFSVLVDDQNDTRSMVYIGYCFNLKGLDNVAILWYERAVKNGDESLATFNNLGASYLVAKTHFRREQCLNLAERHFANALQLDATSIPVQFNIVRLSIKKHAIDVEYDPLNVWPQAFSLLQSSQRDPLVRAQLASWYELVTAFRPARRTGDSDVSAIDFDETAQAKFEELHQVIQYRNAGEPLRTDERRSPFRCYLEPVWQ
jgi:tetratricopeptide (TPR) repeat protein